MKSTTLLTKKDVHVGITVIIIYTWSFLDLNLFSVTFTRVANYLFLWALGFCDSASWANFEVREKPNKMQQLNVYYQ